MNKRMIWVTGLTALAVTAYLAVPAAQKGGKSGTTLAGYKTIDICQNEDGSWRYSGEIAVWNEGAVDTQGFAIDDQIQNKDGGGQFQNALNCSNFDPAIHEIAAGTTLLTATTFKYSCTSAPLAGDIKNVANMTIQNHSGHLGTAWGPSPKATWLGGEPPACPKECACTYSQGYWGSKPGVEWPVGFDRNAAFFLSGMTWQQIMDTAPGGNGYFILAKQYIAAILNEANGSCVPSGVQDTLDLATAWLNANTQGTPKTGTGQNAVPATGCYVGGSCGTQKDWGAVVEDYNLGEYPGSPGHCGDDSSLQLASARGQR
jgi:hypothetical protein